MNYFQLVPRIFLFSRTKIAYEGNFVKNVENLVLINSSVTLFTVQIRSYYNSQSYFIQNLSYIQRCLWNVILIESFNCHLLGYLLRRWFTYLWCKCVWHSYPYTNILSGQFQWMWQRSRDLRRDAGVSTLLFYVRSSLHFWSECPRRSSLPCCESHNGFGSFRTKVTQRWRSRRAHVVTVVPTSHSIICSVVIIFSRQVLCHTYLFLLSCINSESYYLCEREREPCTAQHWKF